MSTDQSFRRPKVEHIERTQAAVVDQGRAARFGQAEGQGATDIVPSPQPPAAPQPSGTLAVPQVGIGTLLLEGALLSFKGAGIGAGVGALVSSPGGRKRAVIKGAVVGSAVTPAVTALFSVGREYVTEQAPEVRSERVKLHLKVTGVGLLIGLAAMGTEYALR